MQRYYNAGVGDSGWSTHTIHIIMRCWHYPILYLTFERKAPLSIGVTVTRICRYLSSLVIIYMCTGWFYHITSITITAFLGFSAGAGFSLLHPFKTWPLGDQPPRGSLLAGKACCGSTVEGFHLHAVQLGDTGVGLHFSPVPTHGVATTGTVDNKDTVIIDGSTDQQMSQSLIWWSFARKWHIMMK